MAKSNDNLSELQKNIIFQNGTERAFDNEYWDNKQDGIYVDIIDSKALFSSKDKFDSAPTHSHTRTHIHAHTRTPLCPFAHAQHAFAAKWLKTSTTS